MDNKDELQDLDFDLEAILNEFHETPEETMPELLREEKEDLPEEMPQLPVPGEKPKAPAKGSHSLLAGLHFPAAPKAAKKPEPAAEPEPPAPELPEGDDLLAQLTEVLTEPEEKEPEKKAPARSVTDDTLVASVLSELKADPGSLEMDDLLAEALKDLDQEVRTVSLEETEVKETPAGEGPDLSGDTRRFAPPEEKKVEVPEEKPEEKPVIPPPIQFTTPRSRLRELKKKLVAGPEKRYYVLSEAGIGKLQAAILVNVAAVLICAGVTALYALDMVPENRLRLLVFSQVLAMLVSGLMGCQLMLDAIGDLFKGRFTVNTLLTVAFGVCIADAVYCLEELRVPCCAAFCLAMTMALWARYEKHTTEMAQMDTMRKAVRLTGIVRKPEYYEGMAGYLRTEGEVEDFMDIYNKPSGPEKCQSVYALISLLLCVGIAVFAGMNHGTGMAVQILSTSLLVAVPASFFVAVTRPAAILERRLHMVGTVLCGWQGVKVLCGKAVFPLDDTDLFPQGCTKLNGVKFYGDRTPDEVVSYTASLIYQTGSGLIPLFQKLLESREGEACAVANFRSYGGGGIGGEVRGEPVLMGDMDFMQDMGVEIPEGTMVNQAIYAAIDGQLSAVFAISYAKMRSATAGLVTLSSYRRLHPVMVGGDFMVTEEFIQSKFGVKTKRITFPDWETRRKLKASPVPEATVLAMTTRQELVSAAYAVTGARALATATRLGVAIHIVGGILGMLMMLALAVLGNTELLVPTNVLLYQLIWALPGLLVTEWARLV